MNFFNIIAIVVGIIYMIEGRLDNRWFTFIIGILIVGIGLMELKNENN